MKQLIPVAAHAAPALIDVAGDRACVRFLEFFTANIRNRNTRRAYAQAVSEFLAWCGHHRVPSITAVQPLHVAGYIEELTRARSAPTAKQRLSAIRHLFDWLVVGQVMPANPAASVRGPSHVVKRGKTPVLSPEEARHTRCDRREHPCGPARPRPDRPHGVFVRAHRRGASHEGRGRVRAEPPAVRAAA
jgi:Phage integrase, N-terminal SAM-like domain